MPTPLDLLDEEAAFQEQWEAWNDCRRRDIPLERVLRSEPSRLFRVNNANFPMDCRIALGSFMQQLGRSQWMKKVKGWGARAALAVSSRGSFNGIRYCYCRPGQLCGEVHHCPRCALELVIKPLYAEYANIFEKAPCWIAMVPSMSFRSVTAGLHKVTRKDEKGVTRRKRHARFYEGRPDRRELTLDIADADLVTRLLQVPFQFMQALKRRGLIDGAFATREVAIEFLPRRMEAYEVSETVLPHGHALCNTRRKVDWRYAEECYRVYVELWERHGLFEVGYPDLVVGKPMVDQAEIERWIGYIVKSLPFDKIYREAVAKGCKLEHLNFQFDQTIFLG